MTSRWSTYRRWGTRWTALWAISALMVILSLTVACGGDEATPVIVEVIKEVEVEKEVIREVIIEKEVPAKPTGERLEEVTLGLQWVVQAQFAGYFAANDLGFYADEGLEVTIRPGGPDVVQMTVLAAGGLDFAGNSYSGGMLPAWDVGVDTVAIAQIHQRSGLRFISWRDTGILTVDDWAGKKIGIFTQAFSDTLALMAVHGLDEDDVDFVQQAFNMNAFEDRDLDVATVVVYNELAQTLEFDHDLDELVVFDPEVEGTGFTNDSVLVMRKWLGNNRDTAVRFLRATFKGWIYCRDNPINCVDIVLDQGPALPRAHQTWMMNEVNKLMWPAPNGIGFPDFDQVKFTGETLHKYEVLSQVPPAEDIFLTDVWEDAIAGISGDTKGLDFEPLVVTTQDLLLSDSDADAKFAEFRN